MSYTSCGRYKFDEKKPLGGGAEAIVVSGVELCGGKRSFAMKVFKRPSLAPPAEYSMLTSLPPHRCIISAPVRTGCKRTSRPVLVFPLYRSDLHSVVATEDVLGECVTRDVIRQLAEALCHLHANGVAHNDLKLENVLVSRETAAGSKMDVVLADFGLARRTSSPQCVALGTDDFMAPEVKATAERTRDSYDGTKSDVWSLGIVASMCLTHHGARVTGSSVEFVNAKPLSAGAAAFIRTLCAVNPDDRPTAAEVLGHPWLTSAPSPTVTPSMSAATSPDSVSSMIGGRSLEGEDFEVAAGAGAGLPPKLSSLSPLSCEDAPM